MFPENHYLTVTEAKARLLQVVRELEGASEPVAITRGGVPSAFLLSPERYYGLLETIDLLSDKAAMGSLRRSLEQARDGNWISEEKAFSSQS